MLGGSQAIVSAWRRRQLVGFGRATSDGVYRAVLWDVVVANGHQGQGVGRRIMEALLSSPAISGVERVYLMTTNGSGFYQQLGFSPSDTQNLLVWEARSELAETKEIENSREFNHGSKKVQLPNKVDD